MSERKDPPTMDPKTYIMTQMRIIEMGKIADSLDLDTFLKCIENAQAIAPMAEPELAMKAAAKMEMIKRLARVARNMKIAYGETYKSAMGEAVGNLIPVGSFEKGKT